MAEQTRKGHVYIISNIGSFGENIYIDLYDEGNEQTRMELVSTNIFQVESWGKNERNCKTFLKQFEKSLII